MRRDESRWPVAILAPTAERELGLLEADIAWIVRLLAKRERFSLVVDLRVAPVLNASERALWARTIAEQTPVMRRHLAGVAFAAPSAVLRGMLTAIFWVKPLPTVHVIVEHAGDAATQARAWLDAPAGEDGRV